MKKIMKLFVYVAAAAMTLASCQKNEIDNQVPQEYEYTFLIGNADTKAVIGDESVVWEDGDQMGVYTKVASGTISKNAYGDITPGSPATMKMYSDQALAIGDYVYAYYPYNSDNEDRNLMVTLSIPSIQDGKDDMPMVAIPYCVESAIGSGQQDAPAGKIKFANLGSVIEFHVYSTTEAYNTEIVKSVTFNAEQAIAGDFTFDLTAVDYSKEETLAISGYKATTVVSTLSTSTQVSADKNAATVVKMVVAPGSYTGNVVVTTDKAIYTYPISTAKAFKRSGVQPFGLNLRENVRQENTSSEPVEITATLTFDDESKRTEYSTLKQVWTENGIILTNEKSDATTNVGDYCEPARFYKGSKIYVEAPGNIVNIVFNCNSGEYATALNNSITNSSKSGNDVTLTLDGNSTKSPEYQMSAKVFVNSVTVTYMSVEGGETPEQPTTPVLTVEPSVIEVEAAGGAEEITYTVENPIDGVSVTATPSVEWITCSVNSAEKTVTFNVEENIETLGRTATITLSYGDATPVDVTVKQAGKASEGGETVSVTDILTRATTGVSGTNYKDWTYESTTTSAKYAGNSAGGNESIQLRSNNNNSGIVTTVSAGVVKKIVVTWNANTASDRQLEVYGKSSAYTNASELYSTSTQGTKIGTINCGTSELVIDGNYQYVGLRSKSGAMYLSEIQIVWEGANGGSGESPSEPEPQEPYIRVSQEVFNVPATQTSVTFTVEANVGWGVEHTEGVTGVNIIEVSEDELVLTVEAIFGENESAEPQTHTITFVPEQLDETVTVTINQAAKVEVDDSFEPGEYWIVANKKYAMPLTGNYGYLQVDAAGYTDNVFTISAVDGGYTIKQPDGKYLYMTEEYDSFNVSADPPAGHVWAIAQNGDGSYKILNVLKSKYVQLDSEYGTYGSYTAEKGTMPNLVPADAATARPVFSVTSASKNVACDVTEASFEIVSNQNWTIVPGEGVTVNVTSGSGNGIITMTFAENKSEEDVSYTAIVKADGLEDIVLTVVQSGIPTGDVTETVVDLTWTLGSNAYDGTTTSQKQTATINGVNYSNLLKLGTKSASGSASIKLPAGTTKVTYSAVAWKGASCTLKFTVGGTSHTQKISANNGATGNPKYTITSTPADNYELVVSVDQETTMTVTTTTAVRAILWDLKAVVVN